MHIVTHTLSPCMESRRPCLLAAQTDRTHPTLRLQSEGSACFRKPAPILALLAAPNPAPKSILE